MAEQAPFLLPIILAVPEDELMMSVCRLVGCKVTPVASTFPVPANSDLLLDFTPPIGHIAIINSVELEVDPSEIFDITITSDIASVSITKAMGKYVLRRRVAVNKFEIYIKNTSPDTEGVVKIVIDAAIAPTKNYETYKKSLDSYVDFHIRLLQQLVRVGYFSQ